jgi:hypothetical protein
VGDTEDPRPDHRPGPGDLVRTCRCELSGNLGASIIIV